MSPCVVTASRPEAGRILASGLFEMVTRKYPAERFVPVLILVGCPDIIGDSVGPRVGSQLEAAGFEGRMYGTMALPFSRHNARSIAENAWNYAAAHGKQPLIIAVDAAVGLAGRIIIRNIPLQTGKGAGKPGPVVGQIQVTAGVTESATELDIVPLETVVQLTDVLLAALMSFYEMWSDWATGENRLEADYEAERTEDMRMYVSD